MEVFLGHRGPKADAERAHPYRLAVPFLACDVHGAGGIISDEHGREAGDDTVLGKLGDLPHDALPLSCRGGVAIEDTCGHGGTMSGSTRSPGESRAESRGERTISTALASVWAATRPSTRPRRSTSAAGRQRTQPASSSSAPTSQRGRSTTRASNPQPPAIEEANAPATASASPAANPWAPAGG